MVRCDRDIHTKLHWKIKRFLQNLASIWKHLYTGNFEIALAGSYSFRLFSNIYVPEKDNDLWLKTALKVEDGHDTKWSSSAL